MHWQRARKRAGCSPPTSSEAELPRTSWPAWALPPISSRLAIVWNQISEACNSCNSGMSFNHARMLYPAGNRRQPCWGGEFASMKEKNVASQAKVPAGPLSIFSPPVDLPVKRAAGPLTRMCRWRGCILHISARSPASQLSEGRKKVLSNTQCACSMRAAGVGLPCDSSQKGQCLHVKAANLCGRCC